MSQGSRADRVGELVRNELNVQLRQNVRDPGVDQVTITYGRMSKDLQQARVFYTGPTESREKHSTLRAFKRVRPFLKRQLGKRLKLRHVPELRFEYDISMEKQERITVLFNQIQTDPTTNGDDNLNK